MRFGATVAILLPLVWSSGSAADRCPSFAGQEWEFTGHLVNRIFPGPPDYESVTSDDQPITRWYLQLPWPACFSEYRYLPRFQLSFEPGELERYRPLLGKQVTVKGALEEGVPGRHTTSLVIDVYSIVPWEREKP
jgi:Domain of unknown function (DUF4431)